MNTQQTPNSSSQQVPSSAESEKSSDVYLGSEFEDNYVYAGAMNLAWNELADNIIHEKIGLNAQEDEALALIKKLNNAPFTTKDLDEESYYIKSGYGPDTVKTINTEVKTKFPDKSFPDLAIQLAPLDIISYAYLLKKVQYVTPFEIQDYSFEGTPVKGFTALGADQKANVKILKYWNDDMFILSLALQDDSDELFLAKGFPDPTPDKLVDEINALAGTQPQEMGEGDWFRAPFLKLDYAHDFKPLMGKQFLNKGFEDYVIGAMQENIKFEMDNTGARVEAEAFIVLQRAMDKKIKKLVLDKPFWVVMKRKNSLNPYFILGIRNTNFMEKTGE